MIAITKPKKKSINDATPNFVLSLKLDTETFQEDILNKRLDMGRRIYNACLNELGKRYRLMVESKEYQRAIKLPKGDGTRNRVLLSFTIRPKRCILKSMEKCIVWKGKITTLALSFGVSR